MATKAHFSKHGEANYSQAFIWKSAEQAQTHSGNIPLSELINDTLVSNRLHRWSQPTRAPESLPIPQLFFPNPARGHCQTNLVSFDRGIGNTQPELSLFPTSNFWLSLSWLNSTRSQRARKIVDTTQRCHLLRAQSRTENGKEWIWRSNRHFWHNIKHQVNYIMLKINYNK